MIIDNEDKHLYAWIAFVGVIVVFEVIIIGVYMALHWNEADKGIVSIANYLFYYALLFWKEYGWGITFGYSAICIVFPDLSGWNKEKNVDDRRFHSFFFKFADGSFLITSVVASLLYPILYGKDKNCIYSNGWGGFIILQVWLYFCILWFAYCFIYTMQTLFNYKSDKETESKELSKCEESNKPGEVLLKLIVKECPKSSCSLWK